MASVNYELVVDSRKGSVWLALLKDGKLIELHEEKEQLEFAVGDIYHGKVRKIVPSLNACFVDVGYEKDAFLHYLDLGPQFKSLNKFTQHTLQGKQNIADLLYFKTENDIDKEGKIADVVSASQHIMVQVAKEPISSKGPRLSAEVTLAGRYIVLVPFSDKVSISQKIKDREERDRLRNLMRDIKPKNFGVIIRTVAKGKKIKLIQQDLENLLEKWKTLHKNLLDSKPPRRILGELNKASSLIRDLLNSNFTNIYVNDDNLLEDIQQYISTFAPEREKILKRYRGKLDIFERFGINKQIKTLFGKKVPLPSGGYLIIEHTEAMHVVDVNSGNRKDKKGQESNALATNVEAAEELSRVLQLRDMGGIIAVDFIDMHERENNKILHEKIKGFMKSDRAKHNIIPPSRFGVVEITRQRVRPQTEIQTSEKCPACDGTGEITASILFADEVENNLIYLIKDKKIKNIILEVHPYIASHFKVGLISKQLKWFLKYKKWIPVHGITSFNLLEYHFKNNKGKAIKI